MSNTYWTAASTDKLMLTSGQFSAIYKDSVSITSIDANPYGMSWDGTDTLDNFLGSSTAPAGPATGVIFF